MPPQQSNPYESYVPQSQQGGADGRRKLLVLGIVGVVALLIVTLLLSLLGGKSKVVVNVESNSASEITYRFVNQAEPDDITEVKDTAKHVEVELPSGSYELTVLQDETNYFSVVEAGGEPTEVNAAPQPEKGRRFVGNQPKDCMYFLSNHLVSYDCDGGIDTLQTHVPAKASQPTFNRPNPFPTEDVIEGLIETKEGNVLMIYEAAVAGHEEFAEETGEEHSPHVAFNFKNGLEFEFENRTSLPDLGEEDRNAIQPYREGFLAYDTSFTRVAYYASLKAKSVGVTISSQNNTDLKPYALTTRGPTLAIAYSEGAGSNPETASEVVLQDGDQTRHYDFSKTFSSIRLCGDKKLCGLSGNVLDVYDVNGEEARLLYTIDTVQAIENFKGGLVVIRENDVLSLGVDSREGYVQYNFDGYSYCGVQPAGDTYLLCVTNSRGGKSVLYMDQRQASDAIDKKVAGLLDLAEVTTVSTYGRFITISPNAGEVKYQAATDTFGYDPAVLKSVNAKIKQKVMELGFGKNYQIKNTLE